MANTLKIKRGTAATIPQGQLAEPLFTTDTYDLYIGKGSGGNQRIQNYIASGTSSQFLKGDGSLDSNTYQTALTFSSPLVNTSGTVTINQSSGSVDGYLSSTDWTTFNSKEPAITAGTTLQYYRGDKTFQTLDTSVVPENGPIYFTEPRVRATVLTGLNLSGGGTIAATDSILTAFGKVQNQISALVGGATYQGTWNASTNTPTLASGTGTKGYYYVVSVAGSTNLDGITDWKIGDWAIFNGTTWDKVDNTDAVSSVNGFTGAVNLALDNISDVSAASPTNAQLLRFNGTSSLWENWTPTYISGNQTITLSGDVSGSGTTAITTTIGGGSVTAAKLATFGAGDAINWAANTDTAFIKFVSTGDSAGESYLQIGTTDNGDEPIKFTQKSGATEYVRVLIDTDGKLKNGAGTEYITNSGTWDISTTGNAATATKLATARTLTIGATGKTFDGSANVSWSLAEIGAEPTLTKGNLTETTSSVLTITGGTGAVIGSGTTIEVKNAGLTQTGVVTTGTQTLAGAKTLTALLTGTRVSMTDSITSGVANSFAVTQTQRNGTDTGDIAMSVSHTITASSASNQLVIRAMSFGTNNNLTGGGAVTNYRGWNVASSTQTGTTTTHLDQIYIERGTADGTVTNNRAIRINNMQGTNRAAFFVLDIGDGGTNNSYMVLGSDASATIPTGNWGIYQIQSTYNNYFNGKVLIKTTTDAGYALDVNGTARLTGALTGTSATFSSLNITAASGYATITTDAPSGVDFIFKQGGVTKHEIFTNSTQFAIYNTTTATVALGIANATGAATFSSSVTAGSNIILPSGFELSYGNGNVSILGNTSTNTMELRTNNSTKLSIASTGAATFSSSVTASNQITMAYGGNPRLLLRDTDAGAGNVGILFREDTNDKWTLASVGGAFQFFNEATASNALYITSGNNVGIGTTSPAAQLHVSTASANTQVRIGNNSTYDQFIYFNGNNDWSIGMDYSNSNAFVISNQSSLGTNDRVVITTGGNVGIGTASPTSAKLVIDNTANNTWVSITNLRDGGSSSTYGLSLTTSHRSSGLNGVNHYGAYITPTFSTTSSNIGAAYGAFIQPIASGNYDIAYGYGLYVQALTVASGTVSNNYAAVFMSGNVGIGSSTPSYELQVLKNQAASTTISIDNNTGNTAAHARLLLHTGGTASGDPFVYFNNEVTAWSIGCDNSDSDKFKISQASTLGTNDFLTITSGGEVLINTQTDSGAYYLQVNGSVYATAYYESSDIRLKDVLTNSYSENFSAIEFMWKDKRDDKKHWGYAAQDVMKYIPDAIEVNNDGMMTVNYNEAHTWKIAQLEAKIVELEAKLK